MRNVLLALLVFAPTAFASAQTESPIELTTDPADRAVMAEATAAIVQTPDLVRLDSVLAKLPRPTPLRGMVQSARSEALVRAGRVGDAVAAIDEALRLLPDHPVPKLYATSVLLFAGAPQRAADLWLEAARLAPESARGADEYALDALIGRLRDMGDGSRADRVLARMGEIGFAAGDASQRSASAFARVRAQLAAGDRAAAEAAMSGIGDPSDVAALLIDRRYERLWPVVERWAGPGLEAQSLRWFEELRREWAESGDFRTAASYARALVVAKEHTAVVTLFLPMYDRSSLAKDTEGMEFLAPMVARSLAALGREDEGRRLLERVASLLHGDMSGRDLNPPAALVTTDANALRWADVAPRASDFLTRAQAAGPAVNRSAALQVLAMRGCAYWHLGRRAEAEVDMAEVLLAQAVSPGAAWRVLVCRGDEQAQRALVLARLQDEETRGWALGLAQPIEGAASTPLDRIERAAVERVRRAPEVMAAIEKVGRVLPRSVGDRLPVGFDPYAARPSPKRPPDDA